MQRSIAALAFLGVALFAIIYSLHLQLYTSEGPGAGLFPLVSGVILGLTALLWLVQIIREGGAWSRGTIPRDGLLRAGLQLVAFVLFVLLLRPLGYIASSFILVVLTALIAGERSWFWTLAVALIASVGLKEFFGLLGTTL